MFFALLLMPAPAWWNYILNPGGLRFLVALMVVLQQVSGYKINANTELFSTIKNQFPVSGAPGVSLFFVPSGFLIFSACSKRMKLKKKANVENFYVRRIVRIWPLHFGFGIFIILCINYIFSKTGISQNILVATNLLCLFTLGVNF